MVLNIRFEDDIIKLPNKRSGYMQKTSYISCPISDCRARLSNVGIGYTDLGDDVYKFNSVQKKGDSFSFYATVTLRASGMDGTDVSVDLTPDSADEFTPENVNEIYDKFMSKFFKALSESGHGSGMRFSEVLRMFVPSVLFVLFAYASLYRGA